MKAANSVAPALRRPRAAKSPGIVVDDDVVDVEGIAEIVAEEEVQLVAVQRSAPTSSGRKRERPSEVAAAPPEKRRKGRHLPAEDDAELAMLFPELIGDPRPRRSGDVDLLQARVTKYQLVDRISTAQARLPPGLLPDQPKRATWTRARLLEHLRLLLLLGDLVEFKGAPTTDLDAAEDLAAQLQAAPDAAVPAPLLRRNRIDEALVMQLRRIAFAISELTQYHKDRGVDLRGPAAAAASAETRRGAAVAAVADAAAADATASTQSMAKVGRASVEPQGGTSSAHRGWLTWSGPCWMGTDLDCERCLPSASHRQPRKPATNMLADLGSKDRKWAKGTGYGGATGHANHGYHGGFPGGPRGGARAPRVAETKAMQLARKTEAQNDVVAAYLFERSAALLRDIASWAAALPNQQTISTIALVPPHRVEVGCGAVRSLVRRSGMLLLLAEYLRSATLEEVVSGRLPCFCRAFQLLLQLSKTPSLAGLLFERLDDASGDTEAEEEDDMAEAPTLAALCPTLRQMVEVYARFNKGTPDPDGKIAEIESLIRRVCDSVLKAEQLLGTAMVAELRRARLRPFRLQPGGSAEVEPEPEKEIVALRVDPTLKQYLREMRAIRFDSVEGLAASHAFMQDYTKENSSVGGGANPARRLRRISNELSSLASGGLPVESGSAIFLRVDEDCVGLLQALIVGPEDSPYENGLFQFDIYLPARYPEVPPRVKLMTTGGGRVRFNPNLYDSGKVCLSLLGTWQGPGWDPNKSTLLQVLVSIQSLILVNRPYFNEPGFERSMGNPHGEMESLKYSFNIRRHTLRHAICEQLSRPPPAFAGVVAIFRRLKRRALLEQARIWLVEAEHFEQQIDRKQGQARSGEPSFEQFGGAWPAGLPPANRGRRPASYAKELATLSVRLSQLLPEEDDRKPSSTDAVARRARRKTCMTILKGSGSGAAADDAMVID